MVHVAVILSKESPKLAARALRKRPELLENTTKVTRLDSIVDKAFALAITQGYDSDLWCTKLLKLHTQTPIDGLEKKADLWWFNGQLLIPNLPRIRAHIFQLAHDALGHYGFRKSYKLLQRSFYWPKMRDHLEKMYFLFFIF